MPTSAEKEALAVEAAAEILITKAKQLRFEANALDSEARRLLERASEIRDGTL